MPLIEKMDEFFKNSDKVVEVAFKEVFEDLTRDSVSNSDVFRSLAYEIYQTQAALREVNTRMKQFMEKKDGTVDSSA
jgi:hypothetical protein